MKNTKLIVLGLILLYAGLLIPQLSISAEKAEVFVQLGNTAPPQSGSISSDGKFILSAGSDSRIVLWDLDSGREIRRFEKQETITTSVVFSPDGSHALSGSYDKTVKLWDVSSGKLVRTFKGHTDTVNSVAFSPDGKLALSGGDNTLRLWDVESGRRLRTFKGHKYLVFSVAFSPDGKQILSGSGDHTLKLWDIESGREIRTFEGHSGWVISVAFSPDGVHVVSGSDDDTLPGSKGNGLKIWDIKTGRVLHTLKGHKNKVVSVAYSPDGRYVLSGSDDKTLIMWNSQSGHLLRTFRSDDYVSFGTFSPSGKYILSGGGVGMGDNSPTGEMKLWYTNSGKVRHYFKSLYSEVRSVAAHPSSLLSLSGSDDASIFLWDLKAGKAVRRFNGHSDGISALQFTPDGSKFISGSWDGTAKLWDLDSGQEIRSFQGHKGAIYSVALSPGEEYILSAGEDASLRLWDLKSGNYIRDIGAVKGHEDRVSSVSFSADGKFCITGGLGYKPLTSREKRQVADPNGFGVVRSPVGEVIIWDVENKRKLFSSIAHNDEVNAVQFSPDGKYAASASNDGTVILWDIKKKKMLRKFTGHSSWVTSLAFTPDGKYIISGSEDEMIRLWNITNMKEVLKFKGHLSSVNSIAISPNGKYLISGSSDGSQRLWDISSGRELLRMVGFTDGEWIAITPEGYYNASLAGHKYLNVRMGNKVYGIDQFYDVFYRPDIVRAKLAGDDISDLITLTIDEAIKNPPPEVRMGNAPDSSAKEIVKLGYNVKSTGGGIGEVRVFHNGKLVKSDGTIRRAPKSMLGQSAKAMNSDNITRQLRGAVALIDKGSFEGEAGKSLIVAKAKDSPFASSVEIEPVPGENEVSIIAFNAQNSVQSLMKNIHFTSTRKPVPPRLYILAIGIDKYVDQSSTLKFAAKDARNMADQLKLKAEALYGEGNVFIQTLYDEQATRKGILAKMKEMESTIKGTDHFILFVASHGVLLGDQYYMVTHDYNGSLQSDQLISSNEFVELSKSIRALSQLYILDTCHAGGMDSIIAGLYDARMSVLAKKMGLHIFASANSLGEALDGYQGNGLFTHNLLDGLNNNAKVDANKDHSVSLVEWGDFSRDQTQSIAKHLGHQQEPLIINFGQDSPIYQLQ